MKKLLRTALAAWAAVILLPACTVPSSYDPAVPHAVTPAVSADTPTDADPSAPKYVALTFDDGPSPRCTACWTVWRNTAPVPPSSWWAARR